MTTPEKKIPSVTECVPDTNREARIGFAEVIYCPGKTDEQLRSVGATLFSAHQNVLASRATPHQADVLREVDSRALYNEQARIVFLHEDKTIRGRGAIAVISAGTTDIPVAEEAACTAEVMG
ncbi:MAG: hypothetical protein KAI66_19865, partial [Lentisphaeria bacterium]|nr:hypothetical protein [Lentisphaeria bacterium]